MDDTYLLQSRRREKIVMQAPVHHLAAKQVHKNPRAAEKDQRAKNESSVYARKHLTQLAEVFHLVCRRRNEREHRQQEKRSYRDQIEQKSAAAQKVFADLEP